MHTTDTDHSTPWLTSLLIGGTRTHNIGIDTLLLLSRLYAGITISSAGLDKLPAPDWMTDQVTQIGFPFPEFSATAACMTEFIAGILLALGLFTRPAAFALAIVMGTAAFGFHKVAPITGMHIAQGFVWLFVAFLAVGAGRISVDAALRLIPAKRNITPLLIGAALALAPIGLGIYYQFFTERPEQQGDQTTEISSISIAGTFNGWDLGATPMTQSTDNPEVWDAMITIDSPGVIELKFAANGSWDVNVGENDERSNEVPIDAVGEPGGENITFTAPKPGEYTITLDQSNFSYRIIASDAP